MARPKPPWIIRTYAGFGTAAATNTRFRENLAKGQRGLSIAFDLPTQNGYDPDDPMSEGEVGVTGVSVAHIDDMAALLDGIPLAEINTSMTINATAPWLMALYLVCAERQGVQFAELRGTTQNDLLKEFVARGTYIFDPATSLRLATDLICYTAQHVPHWNPINCCGYHYMESGAGPVEEIGFAFGNACCILDAVRPRLTEEQFAAVVRRLSFFINSGIELVPEIAKVRAYFALWPRLCHEWYGVGDVQFRAGCQVRSLGLTEQQPEVNIVRIALEALPVILQADARVNALQLPGFREAIQLPDSSEQALSLRTQQVLMHETQLAAYEDLFAGSHVIERETARTVEAALAVTTRLRAMGYARAIDDIGQSLGEAMVVRQKKIATGELPVVGVNCFEGELGGRWVTKDVGRSAASQPGTKDEKGVPSRPTSYVQRPTSLTSWCARRDADAWRRARDLLQTTMQSHDNIMPATLAFARAGGTTGEWTEAIAEVVGGRFTLPIVAPTGHVQIKTTQRPEKPCRILLAKVGLDGHINALKVLVHACRNAGMEVIFLGMRQTPESVVHAAIAEDVSVIGVSSLAGNHRHIAERILHQLRVADATDCRLVMGGIIPREDVVTLKTIGVAEIFTPHDANVGEIVQRIQRLVH